MNNLIGKCTRGLSVLAVGLGMADSVSAHLPAYEGERVRNNNHFTDFVKIQVVDLRQDGRRRAGYRNILGQGQHQASDLSIEKVPRQWVCQWKISNLIEPCHL